MLTWKQAAHQRRERNRYSRTHQSVDGNDTYVDQVGVLGELLFAQAMGLTEAEIRTKGPTAYNFRLPDGTRVDVRASGRPNSRYLAVPPRIVQRESCDVFAFVNVDLETEEIRFGGWAEWQEVADAPVRRFRADAPMQHAIPVERLRPLAELRDRCTPKTLRLF
jgi:hypothetical protein